MLIVVEHHSPWFSDEKRSYVIYPKSQYVAAEWRIKARLFGPRTHDLNQWLSILS